MKNLIVGKFYSIKNENPLMRRRDFYSCNFINLENRYKNPTISPEYYVIADQIDSFIFLGHDIITFKECNIEGRHQSKVERKVLKVILNDKIGWIGYNPSNDKFSPIGNNNRDIITEVK